jgi:hypothetical protein
MMAAAARVGSGWVRNDCGWYTNWVAFGIQSRMQRHDYLQDSVDASGQM